MILERSVSFEVRADDSGEGGDGLTLTGHAAVFNQDTEINSWEGRFLETIAPGAFKKTIRERTPVMQFEHGRHPLIGSIPIGTIESLSEDSEGLYVEGRLTDNWLIQPVRDAIKNKSVNGMSFRFEVVREEWRDAKNKLVKGEELLGLLYSYEDPDLNDRLPLKRTLKELKVAELGPVVFPAYAGTSVDVRAKGMAEILVREQKFVYELRSALALDSKSPLEKIPTLSDEPGLKNDIAKALLFRDAPVKANHSSSSGPIEDTELSKQPLIDVDAVREDAPVTDDHSSDSEDSRSEDAPVHGDHPSSKEVSDDFRTRMHYRLRAMDRRLDAAMDWEGN